MSDSRECTEGVARSRNVQVFVLKWAEITNGDDVSYRCVD
jgi:hypothetical protein